MILQKAVVTAALFLSVAAIDLEPMVAFSCGYGSMHVDLNNGWISDPLTNCLMDKQEILDYCKKAYPLLDVTNIVESAEKSHVKGWCPISSKSGVCKHSKSFKILPYRCLTGPFQSESLVVPEGCFFDHIHEKETCHDHAYWKTRAHESCHGRKRPQSSLRTRSYAMLLPCAVDRFTGVEFVCCPAESESSTQSAISPPTTPDTNATSTVSSGQTDSQNQESPEIQDSVNTDVVRQYFIMPEAGYRKKEHDLYKVAKAKLVERNQERLAKLMKDWELVKKRVEEMRKVDRKGADNLDAEVTPRFQKEYFSIQTNADSQLLQLDSTHQQHVQAVFTEKKRLLAEKLMSEIQSDQFNAERLVTVMKEYIKVENKDAQHCVQHYLKVRSHDTDAASAMLSVTTDHLTLIQTRMTQAIDLLDTLEDAQLGASLKKSINSWRSSQFFDLERTISGLTKQAQATIAPEMKPIPRKTIEKIYIPSDARSSNASELDAVVFTDLQPDSVRSDADDVKMLDAEEIDAPRVKIGVIHKKIHKNRLSEKKPVHPSKSVLRMLDPVTKKPNLIFLESLNLNPKSKAKPVYNKVELGQLNVKHSTVDSASGKSVRPAGVIGIILATVGGVLAVFVVIVVVINRRRAARYQKVASIEEQYANLTSEERCLAAMQNGFENPTYKLLERNHKI